MTQNILRGVDIMTELIDVSTAAHHLGIAKITVYKMVSAKKIPFTKIGRRVLFDPKIIENWIADHTTAAIRK